MPNTPQFKRRSFFKDLSHSLLKEVKTASINEEFPHHSKAYRYTEHNKNTTTKLAAWCKHLPDPLQLPYTLLSLAKKVENNAALPSFVKDSAVTHLLQSIGSFDHTHIPTIVDCTNITHFLEKEPLLEEVSTQPILLLFEQTTSPSVLHTLPMLITALPPKSDLYIGNITQSLQNSASPLWDRINIFVDETAP